MMLTHRNRHTNNPIDFKTLVPLLANLQKDIFLTKSEKQWLADTRKSIVLDEPDARHLYPGCGYGNYFQAIDCRAIDCQAPIFDVLGTTLTFDLKSVVEFVAREIQTLGQGNINLSSMIYYNDCWMCGDKSNEECDKTIEFVLIFSDSGVPEYKLSAVEFERKIQQKQDITSAKFATELYDNFKAFTHLLKINGRDADNDSQIEDLDCLIQNFDGHVPAQDIQLIDGIISRVRLFDMSQDPKAEINCMIPPLERIQIILHDFDPMRSMMNELIIRWPIPTSLGTVHVAHHDD